MPRLNLKQLEAFVQVADLASFRRAADHLNTTQPNISARIQALEAEIGSRLLHRDAGSVRLTEPGRRLLGKARSVLEALDDFRAAADTQGTFEGAMRLGVTEMIVHAWLGTYLAHLRTRFPNVVVDLTVDLSKHLSTGLEAHTLDLVLQSGPFASASKGAVALGKYPFAWVAAPTMGIGTCALSLDDIVRHPILTHARQTLPFQQLERHIAGRSDARLVPSSNFSACLKMTEEGLGVACLPLAMVDEHIAQGRLRHLRYPWVPDALEFSARYDRDRAGYQVREAAQIAGTVAADFGRNRPEAVQRPSGAAAT